MQELIALAKTKPGGLSYASAGIGTTPHLVAEQFKLYTGTDITGVQYRGAAPASHIDGVIRSGARRALAVPDTSQGSTGWCRQTRTT